MSYTVDKDPKSTGLTWWGTTYVKIEGRKAAPHDPNKPIIPTSTAYALVDSGERTHAKDISVNLAVGKRQAKVWREEIYAEGDRVSWLCAISGFWLDRS
eukprot:1339740-Amphidinium_carterae.1